MSRTLVDSSEQRRQKGNFSEDDETLADSIIDSMHSCESEATLHGSSAGGGGGDGGGDTDMEDELAYHPEEGGSDIQGYMNRMRLSGGTPTGGALGIEAAADLSTASSASSDVLRPGRPDIGERVKNETQELSRELLEHVENLRSTLDNMSTRLGTTPEPPPPPPPGDKK